MSMDTHAIVRVSFLSKLLLSNVSRGYTFSVPQHLPSLQETSLSAELASR